MTKVQLDFSLLRPLNDDDAEAVSNLHSYYGIQRVLIAPTRDRITVDYDATRLSPSDVSNAVIRYGVPIATSHP